MAIVSFQLDPTAIYLSDDAVVGKINTAGTNITRANSVEATARPIENLEVTNAHIAADAGIVKTKLADLEIVNVDVATGAAIDVDKTADGITNKVFTTTDETKLTDIEANATADQTGTEIKTAYEGEANTYNDTKDTKLTGIEEGAEADQTGPEIRDLIVAVADVDRKIVITNPVTGEYKITAIQRDAAGELDVEYDDEPVST